MFSKQFLAFATMVASASIGAAHPATQPRMGTQELATTQPMAASGGVEMPQMISAVAQQMERPGRQEPTQPTTELVEEPPLRPQQVGARMETAPGNRAPIMNSGYISGYFPGSFVSDVGGEGHTLGLSEPTANVRSPGRVYAARRNVMAPERIINPRILSPGSAHRGQVIEEQAALTNPRIGLMMDTVAPEVVEGPRSRIVGQGEMMGRMQMRQDPRFRMMVGEYERSGRMQMRPMPFEREIFPSRMGMLAFDPMGRM